MERVKRGDARPNRGEGAAMFVRWSLGAVAFLFALVALAPEPPAFGAGERLGIDRIVETGPPALEAWPTGTLLAAGGAVVAALFVARAPLGRARPIAALAWLGAAAAGPAAGLPLAVVSWSALCPYVQAPAWGLLGALAGAAAARRAETVLLVFLAATVSVVRGPGPGRRLAALAAPTGLLLAFAAAGQRPLDLAAHVRGAFELAAASAATHGPPASMLVRSAGLLALVALLAAWAPRLRSQTAPALAAAFAVLWSFRLDLPAGAAGALSFFARAPGLAAAVPEPRGGGFSAALALLCALAAHRAGAPAAAPEGALRAVGTAFLERAGRISGAAPPTGSAEAPDAGRQASGPPIALFGPRSEVLPVDGTAVVPPAAWPSVASSPYLAGRNAAFVAERAPSRALVKLDPSFAQRDPGSLQALVVHYESVASHGTWLEMRRRSPVVSQPPWRAGGSLDLLSPAWREPPGRQGPLWLRVRVRLSRVGGLVAAAAPPPRLRLEVSTAEGPSAREVSVSELAAGVLVRPWIRRPGDLERLLRAAAPTGDDAQGSFRLLPAAGSQSFFARKALFEWWAPAGR